MRPFAWVALACLALPGRPALALDPRKAISEYHRQSWQTKDGLPQNAVHDIAQTRDGYLWFGTAGGLARFDGVRFTSFLPRGTPGLKNGVVSALCASRDGGLWIGTEDGLTRYRDGVFTTYTRAEGLISAQIATLHEDGQGALWIGSRIPGLTRFKDGRFTRFGTDLGLPDLPVKAVANDPDGNLWVGTIGGLTRMKDGRTTTFTSRDGLAEDRVSALCVDRQGVLWIGGTGGGKTRFQAGRFTRYPSDPSLGAGVFAIREDGDGQIWFATAGAGIARLHQDRLTTYTSEDFGALYSLRLDREGSLWVGTSNAGVLRLKDTALVTYSTSEGLVDKTVHSIGQTKDGRIWIANRYSLRVYQNGRFSDSPLPASHGLFPILVDRSDRVWIGTIRHVARLDGGRWTSYLEGIDQDLYVHALHEAQDGSVWVGTDRGAFRIAGGKVTWYTTKDGLAANRVLAIAQDKEGGVWFGTTGGGLSCLRNGRFTTYTTKDGLPGASVRAIHVDAEGGVWIGTNGDGLALFHQTKFTAFRSKDGLFDESVFQMVEDDGGHLWLCGVEGIARYRKQELYDFAEGRTLAVTARTFGTGEGMRAKSCYRGAQPGAAKTRDGKLWFATIDGVVVVDPADLGRRNTLPPPVVVEAIRVDRRALAPKGPLRLPPGSREIEIEYSALSFVAPEKVQFKYMLQGFDRDWIDPGTRRTVYYMNLRPGPYTFRLKAANNDGVWNESGATLSFELRPRFYETTWFPELFGLGVVVLGWTWLWRRERQMTARQEELAAHVEDRTRALQQEIAERKRVEEALRESEERYALAVRGANDGVWDWSLKTGRVYFSPRWKAILGYEEEEIGDSPEEWLERLHPEDVERVKEKILAHREGRLPHFEDEHRIRHKDGNYRWVLTRGFAVRDGEGHAYRLVGAQTDVTDRRSYDGLTGLPNRALFVERLDRALARARRKKDYKLGVLFLDLDRFKVVNDSLGHLAGDRLIVSIARKLEACVRPGDMTARFGGDEFAVLVDNLAGLGDAEHVARRIQEELQAVISVQGLEVFSSASIGIALNASGQESAEDLLRDADTAMYRAKAKGRGRYEVFDAAMRAQVTALLETEGEFRHAIERRELRVHYQPVVELATGTLCGFEALVRWQHPRRGLVLPGEFIAIAEETGLIVPLGHWVLDEVCRQRRVWLDEYPGAQDISVSVNISVRQFIDRELGQRIRELLNGARLDPKHLILEITESVMMDAAGSETLARLDELGVRLHLDDFGTGYSSLSYLHRFPVEALKIDRSFVAKLRDGEDALVRTILTLARNLDIPAVAEGVETAEQVEALRALGCAMVQGHYFAAAMDARAASALIASEHRWPPSAPGEPR